MPTLVYIPIEGERIIAESSEYIISNFRYIQNDRGSGSSTSIPLHMITEYKLTPKSAMFKVINGIVNVIGAMPRSDEIRGALGLREFDNLRMGDQRKLCEVCGVPFVHPDHPYNRWITVGYHRPFSKHFYKEFAWLKGEEVFTYWPDSFILTNYRLYQYDSRRKKLYMFPLHMVETFEAKRDRLKIQATSGKFDIRGKVPRQDHLLKLWQQRSWNSVPKEHLDWLIRPFSYIQPRHPLSQYTYSDMAEGPSQVAKESHQDFQAAASSSPGTTVYVKPVIRDRCTNCNAPMTWESIDWTGPDQYACPSCGSTHRVEYERF